MAAGGGIPPLSLSTGPAMSEATGTTGAGVTGAFYFKRETGLQSAVRTAGPLLALVGVAWFLTRRK